MTGFSPYAADHAVETHDETPDDAELDDLGYGVCNDGRPLLPCPCCDRVLTCDPGDGGTLEQRIKDTIRATRCRYERDQDHPDEPWRVEDGVAQAVAALVRGAGLDGEVAR